MRKFQRCLNEQAMFGKPILRILEILGILVLFSCTDYERDLERELSGKISSSSSSSNVAQSSSEMLSSSSSDNEVSSSSSETPSSSETQSSSGIASSSSSAIPSSSSSSNVSSSSSIIGDSSSSVAMCETQSYNPVTQFCYNNQIVVQRCGSAPNYRKEEFNPDDYECGTISINPNAIYLKTEKPTLSSKIYNAVLIGTQTWMAENLSYDPSTGNSKCYDNAPANCITYGRLYDWATAITACPSGWHLPNNTDWDVLYRFVDGTSGTANNYTSTTAGRYLKTTDGWNNYSSSSGNGEDTYGFSALPGGIYSNSDYANIGQLGYWWSSDDPNNGNSAHYRHMGYNSNGANSLQNYNAKTFFLSIRCIKDN